MKTYPPTNDTTDGYEGEELEKQFLQSTYAFLETGDGVKTAITHDFDGACHVIGITKLVHKIIDSRRLVFMLTRPRCGKKELYLHSIGHQVLNQVMNLRHYLEEIKRGFPLHGINPYVNLWFSIAHDMRLMDIFNKDIIGHYPFGECSERKIENMARLLNQFVDRIKKQAESAKFKKTVNDRKRLMDKNYNGLGDYFNSLFKEHRKLLVLRIDLGYKTPHCPSGQPDAYMKYAEANGHRERFFNNMRSNDLFKHKVGHIWKLEYGLEKGFHYHMVLFFDGSEVRQDATICGMIGGYWNDIITEGKGIYFNCNAKKEEYKYLGIGMIGRNDTELRENFLRHVASYLTKVDYYARIADPDIGRTFGRGEIVKPDKQ
jgi:hypothetical protein